MPDSHVFDARPCSLGEGALWHPDRQALLWFDILQGRLCMKGAAEDAEWNFGEMASAAGIVDETTLLVATETGLRRFDIASGEHELLAPLEAEDPMTRSNDGRADPHGGFWIGTMGKTAERGAGAIYRFHGGAVEKLFGDVTIPNAICFAPDGRAAYFADTAEQRILRQALDSEGWPDGAPELFADLAPDDEHPDGAVTDAAGHLWVALWGQGAAARYTPWGAREELVHVPGLHSSCPAFGGEDLTTLYVTTALQDLPHPDAAQGLVYAIEAAGKGRAEPRVIL